MAPLFYISSLVDQRLVIYCTCFYSCWFLVIFSSSVDSGETAADTVCRDSSFFFLFVDESTTSYLNIIKTKKNNNNKNNNKTRSKRLNTEGHHTKNYLSVI